MLETIDIAIVALYAGALVVLAHWVSREKTGAEKNAQDYFLASKSLPWWAIGASLIAANISAEQIIGMSGSGYAIGLAIASYEWMAAITLILVGKYLLPVFLRAGIYTMPQFLQQRYDDRVRLVMAFFWLGVYVFVNLTSILWLGSTGDRYCCGRGSNSRVDRSRRICCGLFPLRRSQSGGPDGYYSGSPADSWWFADCMDSFKRGLCW